MFLQLFCILFIKVSFVFHDNKRLILYFLPFKKKKKTSVFIYRQVVERSNRDGKGRSLYERIGSARWNFRVFDVIFFFITTRGWKALYNQLTYPRPWSFVSSEMKSNIRGLNSLWSDLNSRGSFCLLLNVVVLLRLYRWMNICVTSDKEYREHQNINK